MFSICGKKQIEVFLLFYGDKIEIILKGGFSIPLFCVIMPTGLYYDGDV